MGGDRDRRPLTSATWGFSEKCAGLSLGVQSGALFGGGRMVG